MSHAPRGDNPYTKGVAAFVAGLTYGRVPAEVIARLKLLILDSLGCALYGTELPWSRILMATLGGLDETKACAVWGTGRRLSGPHAALVNGTLVQSFELDDVHRAGVLHVGAVTLPALFAVAELRPGMSGRDFLRAAVAGYEIGPRVGLCMGPEHIGQGWHSGVRSDGGAIRRHGQAHACRARLTERPLRRPVGGGRLHRHHRRVRER